MQDLQNKFPFKWDLFKYMYEECKCYHFLISSVKYIVNIYLPEMRFARLHFLQALLCDNKRYLFSDAVKTRACITKNYEEYAVKNVWHLVKSDANFCSYMPSEEMN